MKLESENLRLRPPASAPLREKIPAGTAPHPTNPLTRNHRRLLTWVPSADMNEMNPQPIPTLPPPIPTEWESILRPCIERVRSQYRLKWNGLHGAGHWARVLENGLRLAASTPGIRTDVVIGFAVFHDSCRWDDLEDPRHGARAALWVRRLHAEGILPLDREGLALLEKACRTHTGGRIPEAPTIMACWDGDRLDLPRIAGVEVRVEWLGTALARDPDFVQAATARASSRTLPYGHLFSH